MHKDLFIRQIRFEHTGARVRDLLGQRLLVHLEHGNVLEFVPFFFSDINPPTGKLIDDLIAAKKRHRISRGEIKNGAAQSLLRGGRNLHIEPRQIAVHASAMPASGTDTRVTLTPLARSAINSLSADNRPKTRRIAVNNPHGMVKISENGST